MASEALRDEDFAHALREFTSARRAVLRALLERHEVSAESAALLADFAYGLLWYRTVVGHAPLDRAVADAIADVVGRGESEPRTLREPSSETGRGRC